MPPKNSPSEGSRMWMRQRLDFLGMRPTDMSRALNHSSTSRVYELLDGRRKIQPAELRPMAALLRMQVPQMLQAESGVPLDRLSPPLFDHMTVDGVPPLRVLRAEPIPIGNPQPGRWLVQGTEAAILARPELLYFAPRAFALIVQDEANAPVYHPRDHILINPDLPVRELDDCLFCSSLDPDIRTEVTVQVARLCKKNHRDWTVKQYGDTERKIPKKDWPGCWKIVARYIH